MISDTLCTWVFTAWLRKTNDTRAHGDAPQLHRHSSRSAQCTCTLGLKRKEKEAPQETARVTSTQKADTAAAQGRCWE